MSKKIKVPIALRMVRWIFPKLEKYSPPLATRLFVQLFFTPLHYGFPEIELNWIKKSVQRKIFINGKKIRVYAWGEKPKPYVLFVHGWAGRSTQFIYFFESILNSNYRIIAFDGPAHGKSQGKRTNIIEFVEAIKNIIQDEGNPTAVVCHSFGGVASLMAKANGIAIQKLINIGTPSIGDEIIKTFLRAVNGSWVTAEMFKKYMVMKYGHTFEEFSGEYFLKNINNLELYLIHDEQDKDVPIIHADRVKELYPNTKIHKTNGLGHTRILKDKGVIETCLHFIQHEG